MTQSPPGSGHRDDRGLPAERTALAWLRLALSLLGAALVLTRLAAQRDAVLTAVSAGLGIPLSAAVSVLGWRRYLRTTHGLGSGVLPDAVLPAALAALTALLGIAGLGYVLG